MDSVYHPEDEDASFAGQVVFVHGDTFDTEPDVIRLKPDKKYAESRNLDIKHLPKLLSTYYEFSVVVGPIYRITETGKKKELDHIEIKGVEIKIIKCK